MTNHESSIGQTPTKLKSKQDHELSRESAQEIEVAEKQRDSHTGFEPFDYNKHYGRDDES